MRILVHLSIKQAVCESSHMWSYMHPVYFCHLSTDPRPNTWHLFSPAPAVWLLGHLLVQSYPPAHSPAWQVTPSCDLQYFTPVLLSLQTLGDTSFQI